MAENEYLDSTKARRWHSVAEGIRDGCDSNELTDRTRDRLYMTLKSIRKDLPFADLLATAGDPQKLSRVCEAIEGASDVKDILLEAAVEGGTLREVLERFLSRALHNCLYDVPYLAAELGENVNISLARQQMQSVQLSLAPEVHWIATKLSENPSWRPQRPRGNSAAKSQTDHTRSMLNESLIAGFRR